jgi:phosphatidylserine/phosphatidylglycerophosphate/cardiolipin synthase-like enzyme
VRLLVLWALPGSSPCAPILLRLRALPHRYSLVRRLTQSAGRIKVEEPMTEFRPGQTCWRTASGDRAAFLVASDAYFKAALEVMQKAQHSILLLGWTFDPRTRLAPDGHIDASEPDEIGRLLLRLSQSRPQLDIRLLIWKSALPISATQHFFPHAARRWFSDTRIKFCLDDQVPFGACHHQKVLVIDDRLAFCGGGDISVDRWDSWLHLEDDLRRILPTRTFHAPRHEVMMMVDGDIAGVLGQLFRDRWRPVAGEGPKWGPRQGPDLWPAHVAPDLTDAHVAVARTLPAWRTRPLVDEIRRLTLECIGRARDTIYLENQYFTSPLVTEALAARLREADGPEVVLITTGKAPSWFDRLTMDRARGAMVARLRGADCFGRFHAFSPVTSGGRDIVVHSKCSIFDDRVVRIGSANLNNRSLGFDTECELAIKGASVETRLGIEAFRDRLVGHFIGVSGARVAGARARRGGLGPAIEALNDQGRLRPISPTRSSVLDEFISAYQLGDPTDVSDAWRPLRRRRRTRVHVSSPDY